MTGGEYMIKKKILAGLTIGIIIAAASLVAASITLFFNMPMNANVVTPSVGSLSMSIDGLPWVNGTEIAWGNFTAGENKIKQFDILNNGTISLQLTLFTSGMPVGWVLAFPGNTTTLLPSETLNNTLTLTVPESAAPGYYYWNTYIIASG
jgi:hypothetical protein